MSELLAMLREQRQAWRRRVLAVTRPVWRGLPAPVQAALRWAAVRWRGVLAALVIAFGIVLPLFFSPSSKFVNTEILALAYVMFALGLNIVVGFAGLLDLGYLAFFALGAYSTGWLGSTFFPKVSVHVLSYTPPGVPPPVGIHFNFLLILVCAALITAAAGAIIGLPTLRLRGDYIAIVTLAFGEIIRVFALNGPEIKIAGMPLTGGELGVSGLDLPHLPGVGTFTQLQLRPWYYTIFVLLLITLFVNVRLRDSRLGRAWVALREDEVAAVSMGIPLVRTKLLAYSVGAAFGGVAGAFLASFTTLVDAGQFQFAFSIFVLSMVILGGLGSIWGVVLGALLVANINYYLIPDVLNGLPGKLGLSFNLTDLQISIFGFLLVLVMVLRPQGLIPERRRRIELEAGIGETELKEPVR
jgi:branched-chain amino acid transport system permease protein